MPKQVLIVYGTRYGATESTSEEVARVLREEGLDVKIVNLKQRDFIRFYLLIEIEK